MFGLFSIFHKLRLTKSVKMKEIGNLFVFTKIVDLFKGLGVPDDNVDDKTEFSIINLADYPMVFPYSSPCYRANFYSFVFVGDATGSCSSDHRIFNLEKGTIYFNNPGHIKQFNLTEVKDVYLIFLSESFLKKNVHGKIFEEFPFLLAETVPPKVLDKKIFAEFENLYHQIAKEYQTDTPYRNKLIGHLFVVLLIKIKEYFWQDYNPIDEGNRSSEIVKTFKKTIEKHFRDVSKGNADRVFGIHDYASVLNLNANYLNTVIKSKTGKPIGSWIVEKTISEAKSLLRNSDYPIKEIACRLGFEESSHFSNYFKKHTSVTPRSFRKENHQLAS